MLQGCEQGTAPSGASKELPDSVCVGVCFVGICLCIF